jgi:hypothetical protein|tara:strand:+ start:224 stop:427 length:204 start_codon:yes stop_codon:yes gene_type:complete
LSNPIISFDSQLTESEKAAWLDALSAKLPNECIKLDKDLSAYEKSQCEMLLSWSALLGYWLTVNWTD